MIKKITEASLACRQDRLAPDKAQFVTLLRIAGIFAVFTFIVHLHTTWLLRQMKRGSAKMDRAIVQIMEEGNRGT